MKVVIETNGVVRGLTREEAIKEYSEEMLWCTDSNRKSSIGSMIFDMYCGVNYIKEENYENH